MKKIIIMLKIEINKNRNINTRTIPELNKTMLLIVFKESFIWGNLIKFNAEDSSVKNITVIVISITFLVLKNVFDILSFCFF